MGFGGISIFRHVLPRDVEAQRIGVGFTSLGMAYGILWL